MNSLPLLEMVLLIRDTSTSHKSQLISPLHQMLKISWAIPNSEWPLHQMLKISWAITNSEWLLIF